MTDAHGRMRFDTSNGENNITKGEHNTRVGRAPTRVKRRTGNIIATVEVKEKRITGEIAVREREKEP